MLRKMASCLPRWQGRILPESISSVPSFAGALFRGCVLKENRRETLIWELPHVNTDPNMNCFVWQHTVNLLPHLATEIAPSTVALVYSQRKWLATLDADNLLATVRTKPTGGTLKLSRRTKKLLRPTLPIVEGLRKNEARKKFDPVGSLWTTELSPLQFRASASSPRNNRKSAQR